MRRVVHTFLLLPFVAACAAGPASVAPASTTPPSAPQAATPPQVEAATAIPPIPQIIDGAAPAAPAERIRTPDRAIPRPANAVCVPETDLAADPAATLNRLMTGQYGPVGDWILSDLGGAVNIGGPHQWWFALGDTFTGPNNGTRMPTGGARFIHNAALIQDGNCFWVHTGRTASGRTASFIPDQPDGSFYWPQGSYIDGDLMYTFAVQVRPTGGTGMFAFEAFDIDLAVTNLNNLAAAPTIIDAGRWEQIDSRRLENLFPIRLDDGTVAVTFQYGSNTRNLGVARITNPSNPAVGWNVWNGTAWTPNLSASTPVHTSAQSAGLAGPPYLHNGTWHLTVWRWLPSGETGWQTLTAAAVTGPYTETARHNTIWPFGRASNDTQYGHAVYGTYPALNGNMLMVWSNNAGFDANMLLARSRPTFTAFNPATLTANTPTT